MQKRPPFDFAIIRHGQSEANRQNIFTGWRDSPLSEQGISEARAAGRLLKQEGFHFDIAFTSLQSRAIKTLWLVLEEMDLMWIPVRKHWQLNERHYGALQGKNKVEAVASFGEAQVNKWRRGYAVQPPLVDVTDADYPKFDARYAGVPEQHVPRGESLKDVSARVLPFWLSDILPLIRSGQKVLVAAHGNSLRSLLKHLERLSEAEIEAVNIPTGLAKIYTLDADGLAKDTSYVGDPVDVQARIHSVANQTKKG
jgi:2,3-bisphosphoglycerate-dependent phosphoglycerate mutase